MQIDPHPRVWLNPIWEPIWPIERALFQTGISEESSKNQAIGRSQFRRYNFARRYQHGREVYFDYVRLGLFPSSNYERLCWNIKEFKWLEAKINLKNGKSIQSDFWILNGRFSHITYNNRVSARLIQGSTIASIKRHPIDEANPDTYVHINEDAFGEITQYLTESDSLELPVEFFDKNEIYECTTNLGSFLLIGTISDIGFLLVPSRENYQASKGYYFGGDGHPVYLGADLSASLSQISKHFK
jgi:hypothetical protein